MLWGLWKWSARDDLHVQGYLILSQVGLLFPINHAPNEIGVPDPPALCAYGGQARHCSKAVSDGCGAP